MSEAYSGKIKTLLGLLLASLFAAWGSYLIHVIPIEEPSLPILEALIDFSGRAPDQYRVIPYVLIGAIRDVINLLPGVDVALRYPVLIFDSIFLFLSVTAIKKHFGDVTGQGTVWFLLLVYPFLMFDGYRPTAAFILFLSIYLVVLMQKIGAGENRAWLSFAVLILVMSFTRADVAFLFAVAAMGQANASIAIKAGIAIIPLAIQFLLSAVIFSEAEYFSQLIMITDNLSLRFLMSAPLTYLLIGLLVMHWSEVIGFVRQAAQSHKFVFSAMVGYVFTLFIIARPNEYRLFLPFLPLVLWLLKELENVDTASD